MDQAIHLTKPRRNKQYNVKLSLIKLDDQGFHIIVKGKINELPVNLIVDTGASKSVFSKEYLEKHLSPSESQGKELHSAGIAAEKIEISLAKANMLVLGRFKKTDYTVMLIKLKKINTLYNKTAGISIHGLLGSDFLQEMNALIDFKKLALILRPSNNL